MIAAERLQAGLVYAHESYAVSSGQPISLKELVRTYEQVIGKEVPIQWGGRPYRPREVMVPWNKGDKLPGWEPRVALSEGISRVVTDS
ncbi:hypothetical protein M1N85_02030 [Dehalococcoidia bacterium]|nr:hypothetical protein [Dehalococcoidia bacterium]